MCPCLHQRRIIARAWWQALVLAASVLLLGACSTARLAYNQAPTIAYWWIDGHVDLTDAQSSQLRSDIDSFFAWHRRTELPRYAGQIVQWQDLIQRDLQPEQVCQAFGFVREAYRRSLERGLEPLAVLALQLSAAQLEHLRRHQEKGDQAYTDKYLAGTPGERLETRLERYVDRYETLYGGLSQQQTQQLKTALQRSSFDARRSLAERQRRQAALLQTIRQVQTSAGPGTPPRPAPPAAVAALRAWAQELQQSPTPGYTAYQDQLVGEGCAHFATLHNSTSAGQRTHAVQWLKRHEADLRALAAQD